MSLVSKASDYWDKLFLLVLFVIGFSTGGFLKGYSLSLFLLLLVLFVYRKGFRFPLSYPFFYILSVFISWLLSEGLQLDSFLIELCCFLVFVYSSTLAYKGFLLFFQRLIFIAATIVFLESILALFFFKPFLFTSKNQNYAAFLYVAAFGFMMDDSKMSLQSIFVSFIAWVGCLITLSRTGIVALSFLTMIRFLRFKDRLSKLLLLFFVISSFIVLIRFDSFLKLKDPKAYKRVDIYLSAIKGFIQKPLFGWGPGSFEMIFERYKFPYYDGLCYYNHSDVHAHSHFLNILAEYGIFATLLLSWIISLSLKGRVNYSFVGVLPFFLFDSILYNPFIRMLFFGIMGLSYSSKDDPFIDIRPVLSGCVLLAIFNLFLKGPMDLKVYYNAYLEIFSNRNIFRQAAVAQHLSFYSPYNAVISYMNGLFNRSFQDSSQEYWFKKTIRLEPNFRNAYIYLATFYLERGMYNEFEKTMLMIDPYLPCQGDNFYARMVCESDLRAYENLKKHLNN